MAWTQAARDAAAMARKTHAKIARTNNPRLAAGMLKNATSKMPLRQKVSLSFIAKLKN